MKKIIYWISGILIVLAVSFVVVLVSNKSKTIEYKDLISVSYPLTDTKITSPLIVTGKARGPWFFEASFPVVLTNWDGLIIADGVAQAEGDWMTTDFVPFTATLDFTKPDYGERGFLILKKDNPSGLPQLDDALEIPIYFQD